MNKCIVWLLFLSLIICSSCIPHKDVLYLQERPSETSIDSIPQLNPQSKPYRVQINDILNIRIKVLDALSNEEVTTIFNPTSDSALDASSEQRAYYDGFTVDLQGEITIPQLGDFKVLGMTNEEIENLLKKELLEKEFNELATIIVTVRLAGLRYTTIGEIGTGDQTLFKERANIFEAVANAGDITEFGDRTDVLIIRQYPHGQEIHHIDLTSREVMNSPYYYIQPNDMIYVKPLKQKTLGLGSNNLQTFTTIFSAITLIASTILLVSR
ncbi:polysaccharide biosynthesis/export family protein [Winogradskyella maritima]|uniref:Polysaccharide biosynthesis/export family protein n=1 Tax=Winogradskyella maritima TaxID=1517766 RepID=A0ABV8AK63_9FLAO|nr:polysaccharide biosynthesis/export family protein [Winogradskyella maritima]